MLPALIVLAVIAILAVVLVYLYRRPLPRVRGTLTAKGLVAPVEIIRDRWGVPHIYAQNQEDLWFAQGYVHAQDRLWQMELSRRTGHGRLAEAIGELGYATDRLLRIIGFSRAARETIAQLDAETLRVLEAYSRGVNAYLEANSGRLPLEFTFLRLKPEPWQPLDTVVWGKMMAWGLSMNWDSEILRTAFVRQMGAERAAALQGEVPGGNPIVVPEQTLSTMIDRVLEQFRSVEQWLPLPSLSGMSNNWVVDGTKSATGKPLLANDPHLAIRMPSVWYENHLISPDLEVTGVSFPGVPGVIIGHNAEIAWGVTASLPDVQDLFVEKLDPDDPTQYEYQGKWEKATIVTEEIRVKGEAQPRQVEVTITRHGPIINELTPISEASGAALALRWVGHEPSRVTVSVLNLSRARNWTDFCAALRDWDEPSQSFVYADREGNIGCYMPGKIPIRRKGLGMVPVPGWTDEYDWTGWIPHAELPHVFNPAQHYLATANNRVVGDEYPYFLTAEILDGFRARRIVELLNEKEKLTADDFARIQVDQYCAPAKVFCALLVSLAPEILQQPCLADKMDNARRAIDVLRDWDYHLTADSVPGAIFEVTQYFAMRRVFEPWLGELVHHYLGEGLHPMLDAMAMGYCRNAPLVLQRLLTSDEGDWFKDAEGKPLEHEAVLGLALNDALTLLRGTLGKDIDQWQWGSLHRVGFNHPLGARKPLDRLFNRGPFPYGGDIYTVWQASWFAPKMPPDPTGASASYRQIIDLSDWDASRTIHTTGQSGHPASKHYDDMIRLWLNGEYHPMLWARERFEEHAEARLRLEP